MDTVVKLVDVLKDDFAARSVVADVTFGEWTKDYNVATNRVVVALGDGRITTEGPNFCGYHGHQKLDGTNRAAAVIAVLEQDVRLHIAAEAPAGTLLGNIPAQSHVATGRLLFASVGAIYRWMSTAAYKLKSVRWPTHGQGDVTYGAYAELVFTVHIPVFSDGYDVVSPTIVQGTTEMTFSEGDPEASESATLPPEP